MTSQLIVQVTLNSAPNAVPIGAGQESVRTVAASGRRFKAKLTPVAALFAGGPAVHCTLELEPESASFLPPGTQFELWENGRIGYGSVLAGR